MKKELIKKRRFRSNQPEPTEKKRKPEKWKPWFQQNEKLTSEIPGVEGNQKEPV
jgi:hypothetical protein